MNTSIYPIGATDSNGKLYFIFNHKLWLYDALSTSGSNISELASGIIKNGELVDELRGHDALCMLDDLNLFTISRGGDLWQYQIMHEKWVMHPRPSQLNWVSAAGAPMAGNTLFVCGSDKNLYRRFHTPNSGWQWENHGRPPASTGFDEQSRPVALFDGKLFLVTRNGQVKESKRNPNGQWSWTDHGKPRRQIGNSWWRPWTWYTRVATLGAPMGSKFFILCKDGSLQERYWNPGAGKWQYNYHGRWRTIYSPIADDPVASVPHTMFDGKMFFAGISAGSGNHQINLQEIAEIYYANRWQIARHGSGELEMVTGFGGAKRNPSEVFYIARRGPERIPYLISFRYNSGIWSNVEIGQILP